MSVCLLYPDCGSLCAPKMPVGDSLSLSRKGLIKPSCVSTLRLLLHSVMFAFGAYLLQASYHGVVQLLLITGKNLSLPTFCLSGVCCFNYKACLRQTKHNNSLRGSNSPRQRHLASFVVSLPFFSVTLKDYGVV